MSETTQRLDTSSRKPSKLARAVKVLLGLILTYVLYLTAMILLFRFPPGPHLVCTLAIEGAIDQWHFDNKTKGFPNLRGEAAASLESIVPYMTPRSFRDYGYVPGLQPDDAQDLVLFYVKNPSRRRWHGDAWSPFHPKLWVVVNPQFAGDLEHTEAITTAEFKRRLETTMVFLEKTQRSGWQNSIREHGKFLETLRN